MNSFNILNRDLNIHKDYLIEASAGTGKTFSIQNIVVRLLIEGQNPPLLQKILVVTFTKAATRDLKVRIRQNIEEAYTFLHNWKHSLKLPENAPDYLQKVASEGSESVQRACKRLKLALFSFDFASIYTIHSFCSRMLKQFAIEGDVGIHALMDDDALHQTEIMEIIIDFLRTGINLEKYSPSQLAILLKNDPEQKKLLKYVQGFHTFPNLKPFKESYSEICKALLEVKISLESESKNKLELLSENLIEDFRILSSYYKNHKGAESKNDTLTKVSLFTKLFDKETWSLQEIDRLIKDGLIWLKACDPKLLKKPLPSNLGLHFPQFTEKLKEELEALIFHAADFSHLLARLSSDCQKHLKRYQREEEKLSHDDLLVKMKEALTFPLFIEKVREQYHAVIVDEFQDTDPLQWEILNLLFLNKVTLYLVGDPKQSIYSFRQADIYTYLKAAQSFGDEKTYSLKTNYRSNPLLVKGLNTLFSEENLPRFIPLPKQGQYLKYTPVSPKQPDHQETTQKDSALHFCLADATALNCTKIIECEDFVFFPFIAQEIDRLKRLQGYPFSEFAVLVRDRYQALRLASYFDEKGIPYINQKGFSLIDSPSYMALLDLIYAMLHPDNKEAVRALLCSPFFGITLEQIHEIQLNENLISFVSSLHATLFEDGVGRFFNDFLHSPYHENGQSISQQLLSQENGLEFYMDVLQICDLILENESIQWHTPEGIFDFLIKFKERAHNDDPSVKRFQDISQDKVKIFTLHYSKGLEFGVVFALGLITRSAANEDLISIEREGKNFFYPINTDSKDTQRFYEECDAEKMRQLYVSLTRAKTKLILFVPLHISSKKLEYGEASPIDLFVARLMRSPIDNYEALYERIKSETGEDLLRFLSTRGDENGITFTCHKEEINFTKCLKDEVSIPQLLTPPAINISYSPLWISSFSSLSKQGEGLTLESNSLPHDFMAQKKNVHTLPTGIETGLLIHHIFEKINFSSFQSFSEPREGLSLIKPFCQNSPFEGWSEVIAEMIYETLKTELHPTLGHFCLADLKNCSFYKEMPFMYSGSLVKGVPHKDGLITGVIDLIFTWEERYYILDWKTNWLGSHEENYQKNALKTIMESNNYFLQGEIYKEALRKYLLLIDKKPFDMYFGGIFYLFTRGIRKGKDTGVFYWN